MIENTIFIFMSVLGAIFGSFSSMLIYRLHYDKPGILMGRSACPNCHHVLRWYNLIPVFSWVFQGRKCAYCHRKISFRYPMLEIVFATCFFLFAQKFYLSGWMILALILVFFLLVLFFYDLWYMEVDDRLAFPAIFFAFLWVYLHEISGISLGNDSNFLLYVAGGAIGFLFYAIQFYASGGKWVGAGDMRLGILLGILLGWKMLLLCLFLAYIIGTLIAVVLIFSSKKYNLKSALPMGAFLMPAGLIFFYNGELISAWFFRFLGIPG